MSGTPVRRKWPLFGWLVGLVLVLDQGTKLYVHTTFTLHESWPLIGNIVDLTYVRNSGAAFGLLARQDAAFLGWFFPAITVLAAVALAVYFAMTPVRRWLTRWGIGLIVGGALGNGIDRLWLGQVIDFLDVHWQAYHWPAFNVADSTICVGVGLLLLDALHRSQTIGAET